jgi:hypothetical protein
MRALPLPSVKLNWLACPWVLENVTGKSDEKSPWYVETETVALTRAGTFTVMSPSCEAKW